MNWRARNGAVFGWFDSASSAMRKDSAPDVLDGIVTPKDPHPFKASAAVLGAVTPGANWFYLWSRKAGARQWTINLVALALIVAFCIFMARYLQGYSPRPDTRRVEWTAAGTTLSPVDRDLLRFEHQGGMLRNRLARKVPALAAQHAETVLAETLHRAGVPRGQITGWVLHAGGREVLAALSLQFGLSAFDVRHSRNVLRDCGNLSSPFVLFTLQAALAEDSPGGWWWLSSFGAGFSCHGALLRVE